MILGFDIGNSNTVLGVFTANGTLPEAVYRYRTLRNSTADEIGVLARQFLFSHESAVEGVAFSSVVPELNRAYHEMAERYFGREALEIGHWLRLGIRVRYDDPSQLGADRIVNAEAAFFEYGRDCVIVDIGTAITYCVLHSDGLYDGGMIGPGIGLTIDALASAASRLPGIDFEKPPVLVAKNTIDALKSGFFYGWVSLVEGMVERIGAEYGKNFTTILTGGPAINVLGPALKGEVVVDPMLTMKGIRRVYELNSVQA